MPVIVFAIFDSMLREAALPNFELTSQFTLSTK